MLTIQIEQTKCSAGSRELTQGQLLRIIAEELLEPAATESVDLGKGSNFWEAKLFALK